MPQPPQREPADAPLFTLTISWILAPPLAFHPFLKLSRPALTPPCPSPRMLTSLPSHQGLQLYWLLPLLPSGPSCFSYSKENLSLLFLCHICPQHCQPSYTLSPQLSPDQETASFFCQGSESKYFRLGKLCGLCHNYPTLALSRTGGHR